MNTSNLRGCLWYTLICVYISPCTGCMRLVKEQLNWGTKSQLKAEVLRGIKEIGSVLYWLGLLDIVLVSVLISSFLIYLGMLLG